jgi:hypothetical protein
VVVDVPERKTCFRNRFAFTYPFFLTFFALVVVSKAGVAGRVANERNKAMEKKAQ